MFYCCEVKDRYNQTKSSSLPIKLHSSSINSTKFKMIIYPYTSQLVHEMCIHSSKILNLITLQRSDNPSSFTWFTKLVHVTVSIIKYAPCCSLTILEFNTFFFKLIFFILFSCTHFNRLRAVDKCIVNSSNPQFCQDSNLSLTLNCSHILVPLMWRPQILDGSGAPNITRFRHWLVHMSLPDGHPIPHGKV
jgi:hypothetical protein